MLLRIHYSNGTWRFEYEEGRVVATSDRIEAERLALAGWPELPRNKEGAFITDDRPYYGW